MTNRLQNLFRTRSNLLCVIPCITAGDPDLDTSLALMRAVADNGADAILFAVPFSDPCADTVSQETAGQRALAVGATPAVSLSLLRRFRETHPDIPVILRVYSNLLCARGTETAFRAIAEAGADAVLMPDVPMSMRTAEPGWDCDAKAAGLTLVSAIAPNVDPTVLEKLLASDDVCTLITGTPAQAARIVQAFGPNGPAALLAAAGEMPPQMPGLRGGVLTDLVADLTASAPANPNALVALAGGLMRALLEA